MPECMSSERVLMVVVVGFDIWEQFENTYSYRGPRWGMACESGVGSVNDSATQDQQARCEPAMSTAPSASRFTSSLRWLGGSIYSF